MGYPWCSHPSVCKGSHIIETKYSSFGNSFQRSFEHWSRHKLRKFFVLVNLICRRNRGSPDNKTFVVGLRCQSKNLN